MSDNLVTHTYKPHKKQIEAHRAFLIDGYDRGVLFWGRQVGKSLWSLQQLLMGAAIRQGAYHIVYSTHSHAEQVIWDQYLHSIPKQLIADTNKKELKLTLHYMKMPLFVPGSGWQAIKHDSNQPPSTIRLLGSDYADSDRGLKSNGIIFDEYQDQDPNNWDSVYKYFFTTTKGWACFMGTAKGYNHWYDLIEYTQLAWNKAEKESRKPRWYFLKATWRDNPAIDPGWVEAERKEAEEKGTLDIFMQEVELQFRTVQGSVYDTFDRETHVLAQNDKRIPEDGTLYITWDFGWVEGHPTAINFVEIDNQGKWFVTDEIHGIKIDLDDAISMIRTKLGSRRPVALIADSARPDLVELVRQKMTNAEGLGFPVFGAPKKQGSISAGIILMNQKIKPKIQLTGLPEPDFYITENCRKTIYQFENYRYREHKKDRPVSDLPVKKDDDHPDGLRYLALYLKYGLPNKDDKINIEQPKFNQYGLL